MSGALKRTEAEALAAVKPTTIQTLVFAKDTFKSAGDAREWAKSHGFKTEIDETEDSYRIRQRPPGAFVAGSFRTINITDGVTAVIGKLKSTRVRRVTCVRDLGGDGVERPGPTAAPVAFRIWRSGENQTDHGTHVFSARSAQLLMEEQATRGNLYSIDVDHNSLNPQAPPEARKAVGWHRLEVRAGELWAVDVDWTGAVKSGLESDPPAWRYFSPAYDVDPETNEVISYLNTALTNNPATWNVTALATRDGASPMAADDEDKHDIMAKLARMAEETEDAEEAESYRKAAALLMPKKPDAPPGDGDKDKPPPPPDSDKDVAAKDKPDDDDDDDEAAKKAAKDAADKKDAASASIAATRDEAGLLQRMGELERRDREREKRETERERTTILASRPDLTKSQREYLAKQPVAKVRELLDLIPAPMKAGRRNPAAVDSVTVTRGDSQRSVADDGLDAELARRIDIQCGITPQANAIIDEGDVERSTILANRLATGGYTRTYNTMTPEAARDFLANKTKARGQGIQK